MEQENIEFYKTSEFWILIFGIFIGFVLNAGWDLIKEYIKGKISICRKKKAIESELKTNLGLLPQKIDILRQARDSLINQRILPTPSVHFQTYLYYLFIRDVGPKLQNLHRENLHIIYESFKVADNFLDNLFKDFVESRASGQLNDPFDAYKNMCEEMISRLNLITELINEYLADNPREVTWN